MEDALRRVKGLRTPEKVGGASPHSSQSSSPAKRSPLSKVKTGPGNGKAGGKSKEGRKKKYLSAWCRYKLVGKFQILRVNFSNISRNFKYISNRNSRLFLKLGNVSGIQYTPGLENKKNLHHIIKLRSGRI